MMKQIQLLFSLFAVFSTSVMAETPENDERKPNQTVRDEANNDGPGTIVATAKDDTTTGQVATDETTKSGSDENPASPKKDDSPTQQADTDEATKKGSQKNQDQDANRPVNADLEKAVDEALKAIKKESPQVYDDSLRVWKNFKSTSKPVNFTYRFWGRRLILWLKEEKKIAFSSENQVGDVFAILFRKGLISKNAVVVLTVDAWSHLVYLEGSPSWESRLENRRPEGGTTPNGSDKQASKDQAT